MSFVGHLRARLGLDSAEFSNGLRNARSEASGFTAQLAQGMRGLSSLALGAGAVGAAAAVGVSQVRDMMRDIATIGDDAQRAGLDVEAFQEWSYVAEQARIPIDALTDGFKELSLRADEFVTTGMGSAAESFQRLGFSSDDLARRLQDPSALFMEITQRMQRLDQAARIRVADELFGGTGGEQFVALINRGADGIEAMRARAHELGVVLGEDVVGRATLLDRKFQELTNRVTRFFQAAAVRLFAGGVETATDSLERMFGSLDRARAILGDDLFAELSSQSEEMTADIERGTTRIAQVYDALASNLARSTAQMADVTGQLSDLGRIDELLSFDAIIAQADQLASDFQAGRIDADRFADSLRDVLDQASASLIELANIDGIDVSGAQRQIAGLRDMLASARSEARGLRSELPTDPIGMTTGAPLDAITLPQDVLGGRRARAPRRAPTDPDFGLPPMPSGGGAGGGGGGESYARTAAQIREQTDALIAQSTALMDVAASGVQYGDAVEYARIRSELLTRAQAEGRPITAELTAEIDNLAAAQVSAQDRVDQLTESLRRQGEAGERGAQALTDVFTAAMQGGDAARQAVARLALEIARVSMMSGFRSLLGSGGGGGGIFGTLLGGLFGKNARGTSSWIGGPTLVGEEGPELLNLPTGSQITPALGTAQMMRASSTAAPTVSIAIDARGAQQGVAQEIATALDQRTPGIVRMAVEATQAAQTRGYL